jgi:hypothetical protein
MATSAATVSPRGLPFAVWKTGDQNVRVEEVNAPETASDTTALVNPGVSEPEPASGTQNGGYSGAIN